MNSEKKRNPKFIRQGAPNLPGLKVKWRKPRGLHAKVRMSIKGHKRLVKIGFSNKREIRNKVDGLEIITINNLKELDKADHKKQAIIVKSSIGLKKKQIILNKAKEKQFKIINIRNVDSYLKKSLDKRNKTKLKKQERLNKQQKEEKKEEKKTEEKDEEAKKKEKEQEKRKVLEKGLQ